MKRILSFLLALSIMLSVCIMIAGCSFSLNPLEHNTENPGNDTYMGTLSLAYVFNGLTLRTDGSYKVMADDDYTCCIDGNAYSFIISYATGNMDNANCTPDLLSGFQRMKYNNPALYQIRSGNTKGTPYITCIYTDQSGAFVQAFYADNGDTWIVEVHSKGAYNLDEMTSLVTGLSHNKPGSSNNGSDNNNSGPTDGENNSGGNSDINHSGSDNSGSSNSKPSGSTDGHYTHVDFHGLNVRLPKSFKTITNEDGIFYFSDENEIYLGSVEMHYFKFTDPYAPAPNGFPIGSTASEIRNSFLSMAGSGNYPVFTGSTHGTPYIFVDKGENGNVTAFYVADDRFWIVRLLVDADGHNISNKEMIDLVTGWDDQTTGVPDEYPCVDYCVVDYYDLLIVLGENFTYPASRPDPSITFNSDPYTITADFEYNPSGYTLSDIQSKINSDAAGLSTSRYTIQKSQNNGIHYASIIDNNNRTCKIIAYYYNQEFCWKITIESKSSQYDQNYMIQTITSWSIDGVSDESTCYGNHAFKLFINHSCNKAFYFTGNTAYQEWYLETTDNKDLAVDVYVEDCGNKSYRLYFWKGSQKTYIDMYYSDTGYVNLRLTTQPTAYFTLHEEYGIFVSYPIPGSSDAYFIGSYGDYTTLRACHIQYLADDFPALLFP